MTSLYHLFWTLLATPLTYAEGMRTTWCTLLALVPYGSQFLLLGVLDTPTILHTRYLGNSALIWMSLQFLRRSFPPFPPWIPSWSFGLIPTSLVGAPKSLYQILIGEPSDLVASIVIGGGSKSHSSIMLVLEKWGRSLILVFPPFLHSTNALPSLLLALCLLL